MDRMFRKPPVTNGGDFGIRTPLASMSYCETLPSLKFGAYADSASVVIRIENGARPLATLGVLLGVSARSPRRCRTCGSQAPLTPTYRLLPSGET